MILVAVGEAGARHLGAFDEQLTRSNYIYQLQENSLKKKNTRFALTGTCVLDRTFMFSVHKFNRQVLYETPAHAVKVNAVPCSN